MTHPSEPAIREAMRQLETALRRRSCPRCGRLLRQDGAGGLRCPDHGTQRGPETEGER